MLRFFLEEAAFFEALEDFEDPEELLFDAEPLGGGFFFVALFLLDVDDLLDFVLGVAPAASSQAVSKKAVRTNTKRAIDNRNAFTRPV
jgi:hypothetical protein